LYISVRENRRGTTERTIKRHWQHWTHKTPDKDNQNTKNATQKIKKNMSKTDPTTNRRWARVSANGTQCQTPVLFPMP